MALHGCVIRLMSVVLEQIQYTPEAGIVYMKLAAEQPLYYISARTGHWKLVHHMYRSLPNLQTSFAGRDAS
jgi:hypothetical protein